MKLVDTNLLEGTIKEILLDDKLKQVIEYRMKYKESSLSELAEIISLETGNEISKSGLNHRFRKIRQIIEQIEKK